MEKCRTSQLRMEVTIIFNNNYKQFLGSASNALKYASGQRSSLGNNRPRSLSPVALSTSIDANLNALGKADDEYEIQYIERMSIPFELFDIIEVLFICFIYI